MESLLRDVRFTARTLVRRPAFTISIVLLLGLGIGVNVSIFTLVHAAFLSGLPIENPREVVSVFTTDETHPGLLPISYPNYRDLRDQNDVLDGLAAFQWLRPNYVSNDRPERLFSQIVSPEYFDVLGISAAYGRVFTPADFESEGGSPVVVITHAFWQSHFGGRPDVVGQEMRLNGSTFTIIGVTPRGFKGTNTFNGPDLWFPMSMYRQVSPFADFIDEREWRMFEMLGRVRPGVTVEQAQQALRTIGERLEREYPDVNDRKGIDLLPVTQASVPPEQRQTYTRAGVILTLLVGILLLIACINIAGLILTRSLGRRREIAVRLSLGASRGRLVRQLLTENLLLGLLGGAFGVLLAVWGPALLWRFRPPFFTESALDLGLDGPVLLFAILVSLAAGLLFGLAPALQTTRPALVPALKGSREGTDARKRFDLRNALLVAQIALSLVSLVGAGLFIRSLRSALDIDPGFDTENVMVMSFDLGAQGYDEDGGRAFYRRLDERIGAIPGVESVAVASNRPLMPGAVFRRVRVDGDTSEGAAEGHLVRSNLVSRGFLETAGIPLRSGRSFESQDRPDTATVAIVNETMASRLWPDADPVGRVLRIEDPAGEREYRVVGVAADSIANSFGEEAQPILYLNADQVYTPGVTLYVRTAAPPSTLLETVRSEVQQLDRTLPLSHVYTMPEVIRISLWGQRMGAIMLSAFAFLAVVLAAVGIYGNTTYSVRERSHEIGVRMSLGARRIDILLMILRRVGTVVAVGLAAGFVLAIPGGRLVDNLLYGIGPRDPVTLSWAGLVLAGVALSAAAIAARKGTAIPPATSLRAE